MYSRVPITALFVSCGVLPQLFLRGPPKPGPCRQLRPALRPFRLCIEVARPPPVVHRVDATVLERHRESLAAFGVPDGVRLRVGLEPDLAFVEDREAGAVEIERRAANHLAHGDRPQRPQRFLHPGAKALRSEEHTSELQSLMRIPYA